MKILVLGASGMLGHRALIDLSASHDAVGAVQSEVPPRLSRFAIRAGVDALDDAAIRRLLDEERPDVVLNCVGLIKQLEDAKRPIPAIHVNALLPHRLYEFCHERGVYLVHFSTDCVFSGHRGAYTEADNPDPVDLYGRTKLIGELLTPGALTLRSSIIGHELRNHAGLLEWFLSQRGKTIRGFRHAIYTGLTTNEMVRLVGTLLERPVRLSGLWQVASAPINKFDLLRIVNDVYETGATIEPEEVFRCDRSLIGSRFADETGWSAPTWREMVSTMCQVHERELGKK
jgi:dTDP-4-dehydrorhamnose reductase